MRRTFIFAVAGLAVWPITTVAQQTAPSEPRLEFARGDSGVEHSAHSEAGLLSASGMGAEADLLDASPLCSRLHQARDG